VLAGVPMTTASRGLVWSWLGTETGGVAAGTGGETGTTWFWATTRRRQSHGTHPDALSVMVHFSAGW